MAMQRTIATKTMTTTVPVQFTHATTCTTIAICATTCVPVSHTAKMLTAVMVQTKTKKEEDGEAVVVVVSPDQLLRTH